MFISSCLGAVHAVSIINKGWMLVLSEVTISSRCCDSHVNSEQERATTSICSICSSTVHGITHQTVCAFVLFGQFKRERKDMIMFIISSKNDTSDSLTFGLFLMSIQEHIVLV